jgi:hypothetical protein
MLLGGVIILAGSALLTTNVRGLGAKLMGRLTRNALPRQQIDMERRPVTYRLVFGLASALIGAVWVLVAVRH